MAPCIVDPLEVELPVHSRRICKLIPFRCRLVSSNQLFDRVGGLARLWLLHCLVIGCPKFLRAWIVGKSNRALRALGATPVMQVVIGAALDTHDIYVRRQFNRWLPRASHV